MPEEQCMVSFKLFAAISRDYCPSKNSDTVSHYWDCKGRNKTARTTAPSDYPGRTCSRLLQLLHCIRLWHMLIALIALRSALAEQSILTAAKVLPPWGKQGNSAHEESVRPPNFMILISRMPCWFEWWERNAAWTTSGFRCIKAATMWVLMSYSLT